MIDYRVYHGIDIDTDYQLKATIYAPSLIYIQD